MSTRPPEQPGSDSAASSEGAGSEQPESPALAELYKTLASCQAGLDVRGQEHAEHLQELDAQLQHWTEQSEKAYQSGNDADYEHAAQMLDACRDLRTEILSSLGGEAERYGVTPDSTLDTAPEPGAGVMRTIEPASGTDSQDDGQQ